ncbi:MAG TPA: methyltransferase domain-containing protein [Treponemataceae bacterium]|nr:methyltransferase domain-containing protein [Treponemataceae bacterium]
MIHEKPHCPLCSKRTAFFAKNTLGAYFFCPECKGIHLHKTIRLDKHHEKQRYLEHNNDVNDPGYRKFVWPIVRMVLKNFSASDRGLDFGAGPGPVISTMLKEKGYTISLYDPFFYKDETVLQTQYKYIVCCEVMEHFFEPYKEFKKIFGLLQKHGTLYCKTHLYDESIHFEKWYYAKDPSHVFFYQKETIEWIKKRIGFETVHIEDRLIILSK